MSTCTDHINDAEIIPYMATYTDDDKNTELMTYNHLPYHHTPRTREYLEAKKLKEIYWMIDYRLPEDIARKIMREYLLPRHVIQTIVAVEEDDFWTMHYIWQENGVCNFLKPPGYTIKISNYEFKLFWYSWLRFFSTFDTYYDLEHSRCLYCLCLLKIFYA